MVGMQKKIKINFKDDTEFCLEFNLTLKYKILEFERKLKACKFVHGSHKIFI